MSTTRRHGPVLALAVTATVAFAAAPAALATGTTEPPADTAAADTSGATTPASRRTTRGRPFST